MKLKIETNFLTTLVVGMGLAVVTRKVYEKGYKDAVAKLTTLLHEKLDEVNKKDNVEE